MFKVCAGELGEWAGSPVQVPKKIMTNDFRPVTLNFHLMKTMERRLDKGGQGGL